ncbi:MAG TPA: LLM class F420-dependent oxidoreductase [Ktedonobacterales bacterium]
MAVRFGVFVPQGWRMDLTAIADPVEQYEAMTRVAKLADATPQYDSIWVYDHFHTVPTPELQTTFEAWTITAALARDTQRVKVGQMVTCNGYRNPALLAKMASTVDVLSHGRLYCGLGAGWYEHEWRAYGYGYPETRERMRAFREACDIIYKMWTEDYPTYTGEYYSIDKPINVPKGANKQHPSFWIGGSGEQVTLKLVAKYANAANTGGDPEVVRHKLAVLKGHCDALGRDYDSIIKSSNLIVYPIAPGADPEKATASLQKTYNMDLDQLRQMGLIDEPDVITQRVEALVAAGVNYIIFYIPGIAYDQEPFHLLTESVLPRIG